MDHEAVVSIDHVALNLPEDSFPFWREMLSRLGFSIEPDGNHFDAYGSEASTMVCVTATKDAYDVGYHRKHTGLSHLAVRLPSRAAVDAFAADFLAPRGIEPLYGGPAEYNYTEGYYALYFEDQSRLKIEVMTSPTAPPAGAESAAGPIRHETASVFVVRRVGDVWRALLIMHQRLGGLTITGGHVERRETPAEAAVREAREEAGVEITLLSAPAPLPPRGFPHQILPAPWWIVSGPASPDSRAKVAHVHIDHQFIALADCAAHRDAEYQPLWLSAVELGKREDCLADTRMQAVAILEALDRVGTLEADAMAAALYREMAEA